MKNRIQRGDIKDKMTVLMAEDDPFQRVAMVDLLELCNFTVISCENGIQARDELLKNENEFDLILLDLIMPQLGGLELLKLIKKIDKLKEIPVIMMSGDGEMEVVATCLNAGAQDYLVKPVNYKKLQGLQDFARKKPKQKSKGSTNEKGTYSVVKTLGKGACGSVELVRKSSDQELYALKMIPMYYMNEYEKKNAENEVSLLKVLTAPTIIKYYESFVENDCLNIIMEYAEGGSVFDKIQDYIKTGDRFSKDQILSWAAQLVIAIHFMHTKNILHRDIKTQNMFLTKDNIIKLGDFGISKALGTHGNFADTFLGTPYFMSPEVVKGEKYDQKADIWALGCAVYELVTLKRPFQHEVQSMLYNMILNQDYILDQDSDKDLAMLIDKMLKKDPARRPQIQEIATIPCIEEKINEFYQKHPNETNIITIIKVPIQEASVEVENSDLSPASVALDIMDSVQLKSVTFGLFQFKYEQKNLYKFRKFIAMSGADIKNYLENRFDKASEEYQKIMVSLLETKWIYPLQGQTTIVDSATSYYSFPFFLPHLPINVLQQYLNASNDLLQITGQLITLLKMFQSQILTNKKVDEEKLEKSIKVFCDLLNESQQLQKAIMIDYSQNKKLAVYINLYQIMRFHKTVQTYYVNLIKKSKNIQNISSGFLKSILNLIISTTEMDDDIIYQINGRNYSYMDIKHGVLRNNKSAVGFQQWAKNDPRNENLNSQGIFLIFEEEYIEKKAIEILQWDLNYCDEENVNGFLQNKIKKMISQYVCLDIVEQEIIIHPIFQTYSSDFGKMKQLLEWILKNIGSNYNINQILSQYDQQQFFIRFKDPNIF